MDIRKVSDSLSVSPQITASDIPAIKAAGFRAVIVNRPDGEGADQPGFAEIAQAAHAAGLHIAYVPVDTGVVTDADVAAFGQALNDLPGPALAYCRSGMRSATLWSLHIAGHSPLPDSVAKPHKMTAHTK
ncbi:TIGR01244 family sulfur transferase [Loktanella sp. SALINAS62]|uniref:TIGR01244 family sulfur transferase n=1 Tax=Loktanella sp. SALINAS62 TaxID=2706124 RepID=UPI001B8B7FD0|nr:TIGR01244 family phosphatase [Loktanella sp. SALINAS62]